MGKYNDAVKLWQSWRVKTGTDIDLRLENFRILFAYNSGKIENDAITYNDTREIFENGHVLNYSGAPRTLFELSNQKMCYEYLKPKIVLRAPLTIELIKETHGVLTAGTYDDALAAYDNSEDFWPMTAFLEQQAERTWEKTLNREQRRGFSG